MVKEVKPVSFFNSPQEAMRCLNEHTTKIKLENRRLRHTLLNLIRKSRALNEQKIELEEQKKTLLREKQYAEDLKTIRSTRQHQVYKKLGLEEGAAALGSEGDYDALSQIEEEN